MGFSHGAQVVVAEVDDENWKVIQSFSYTGKLGQTALFLLPAGAVVGLTLMVTFVVEWVCMIPLLGHRAVTRAAGREPRKQVNLPRLPWKK